MKELLLKLLGLIEAGKLDEAAAEAEAIEEALPDPEDIPEEITEAVADVIEETEPEAIVIEHTEVDHTEITIIDPPKGSTGTPGKEPHEYTYKELLALYNASPTDFQTLKGGI